MQPLSTRNCRCRITAPQPFRLARELPFCVSFRRLRRAGQISEFVSVYQNHAQRCVYIASDGGRVCRPLIIVENGRPRVLQEHIQVSSTNR